MFICCRQWIWIVVNKSLRPRLLTQQGDDSSMSSSEDKIVFIYHIINLRKAWNSLRTWAGAGEEKNWREATRLIEDDSGAHAWHG